MLASGSTTRSTELWEMSRSCHRATSSRPAPEVAAQHPGQAAQALGEDGVALVGHGRAALLARLERLLGLAQLAAGQVADLGARSARWWRRPRRRPRGTRRGGPGRSPGWPAPGSGRGRRRRGPPPRGRCSSTCPPRRTACPRPPAPGPPAVAARSRSACRAHRANLAPKVVGSACIPWVRPVTGTSMQLEGPGLEGRRPGVDGGCDEQVGGPGQGGAQRGVHHVGGGQPVVDPRALGLHRCAPGRRRRRRPRRGR